ncbi:amino acid/polyamine transporter I [Xylariaceae sp. FL0255]|nr:amino acid/polyamine transporter I [Xylariaceae sp. FL0255]
MPAPQPAASGSDGDAAESLDVNIRTGLLRRRSSPSSDSNHHHPRKATTAPLTRLNGLAVVISLQIGSGIFSTPSLISRLVSSPAQALLVFILAGLLVWTGAASFVELGQRVPANGGIQEYLRASWGEWAGYGFAWIWVGVAKPAGNAVIARIFADYFLGALKALLVLGKEGKNGEVEALMAMSTSKLVALACVAFLTIINCLGARAGAKAANVFLFLKLAALGSIIAIGLSILLFGHGAGVPSSKEGWFGARPPYSKPGQQQQQHHHQQVSNDVTTDLWTWLGNFSNAAFAALFCYGGWETVGFFAGDMKNPAKDLPVIINGAMTLVIIGFFLMNVALYVCLPFNVIRESTTVAVEFAKQTIGIWGGLVFSLVVAVSAMGAINANMFTTAKLAVAASQRAYFPAILANLHCGTARDEAAYFDRTLPSTSWWLVPLRWSAKCIARLTRELRWENSVPFFALLLNGVLTSVFVLVGTFSGLINLIEMTKALCYMMSVLGLFSLRRADKLNHPTGTRHNNQQNRHDNQHQYDHPRHRTWSGNPIIFASVSGLLILRGAVSEPLQGPSILFLGVLGLAALYRRFTNGSRGYEISSPV